MYLCQSTYLYRRWFGCHRYELSSLSLKFGVKSLITIMSYCFPGYRFTDPTPGGKAREGFVQGGVEVMKDDGFTKSTAVHQFGPEIDSTATLRRLAPYVSR